MQEENNPKIQLENNAINIMYLNIFCKANKHVKIMIWSGTEYLLGNPNLSFFPHEN